MTEKAKKKIPLIERIIVSGVSTKDFQSLPELQNPNINEEILIESLSNLNIHILEEYKSSFLKEEKSSYISNIPKYSIPFELSPKILKTKNDIYSSDKKIISFSLVNDTKLKHCSSLSFYENYSFNNKDFLLKKSITLISSKDYYGTHKDILDLVGIENVLNMTQVVNI